MGGGGVTIYIYIYIYTYSIVSIHMLSIIYGCDIQTYVMI